MRDKRSQPRVPYVCDVECEDAFGCRLPDMRLTNISAGGALIETPAFAAIGSTLHLGFALPSLKMRVSAEVVRQPAEGLGLRFLDLSPVQRVALDEILGKREAPAPGQRKSVPAAPALDPHGGCPLCEGPADFVSTGASPPSWDVSCDACGGKLPLVTDLELRALRRQPKLARARLARSLRSIERPLLLNLAELRAFSPERAVMENRRRQSVSAQATP